MEDYDLFLAQRLQEEFDKESALQLVPETNVIGVNCTGNDLSSQTLSVVDPSWETIDPNPDVHALFLQYNDRYFGGKLSGVEVKWSPRMTLCAGVCSYEGHGGLCSIRLSVPLLKLRPRKDLVETLLHEMIHAFLFVTENDRDRDGHGPNFQKHMHRINKASGANITVYHDFHDEVDNYRQHWWRCNGPCKSRPPYYGWVKRAMNRAPSARDFWWDDHVRSCGGTYTKVKEPDGYGVKKNGGKEQKKDETTKKHTSPNMDIRSFLGKGNVLDGSRQSSKAGATTKSAAIKNPSSMVTNSAAFSSNAPSSPERHDAGVTKGNSTGRNGLTNSDVPFNLEGWSGGIWTPAKNASDSSSHVKLRNDGGEKRLPSNHSHSKENATAPKKTWTVVETKKVKEIKAKPTDQSGSAGCILGSGSNDGLSWLARMRKQWTSADSDAAKSTSSSTCQKAQEVNSTEKQQSKLKTSKICIPLTDSGPQSDQNLSGSSNKPTPATTVTLPRDDSEAVCVHPSDESFHNSFHVSSCEEDNWPTPEKYYTESKASSTGQSKRKRTAIDLTSSDEEDCDLPRAFKHVKPSSKVKSDTFHDSSGSDADNVFRLVKTKNKAPLEDKIDIQKVSSLSPTRSWFDAVSSASVKHTHGTNQNGASGPVPIMVTSTPTHSYSFDSTTSEENAAENSVVVCPSCQVKVAAENINDHLDTCLS